MHGRRRSWWGWGWEDQALGAEERRDLAALVAGRFGREVRSRPAPSLADIRLPPPKLAAPPSLRHVLSDDRYDRALHTYGRSYRDVVRGFAGDFSPAPALVAHPADEREVVAVLDWCSTTGTPAVPYGGGSSVVGGVECAGAVSIDLTRLDRVLEVDGVSRAARIQAGALGPVLEEQLRPHGCTLRHFPQSFEFSTLGGWIATRAGGHFATLHTHIDDLVEGVRLVSPAGVLETRRLPASGAGPSPDRLVLGSEGVLGVVTEAWVRLQERPRFRASAGVHLPSFDEGVACTRAVAQAGLHPSNCRLLDAGEALLSAGVAVGGALLVLGFESADHPVDAWMGRAIELCRSFGGTVPDGVRSAHDEAGAVGRTGAVGAWRAAFLRAPYLRDALVSMGVIAETFETACTWSAFGDLHAAVTGAVQAALEEICGAGFVTCRFTHVYPDGPAPYYSVLAPARPGSELAMWDEVKAAASEAILAAGGTITHHHAVGRDHRRWYDRQRPELFAASLRAVKRTLDPAGVLNPGVLVDPS